MTNPTPVSVRIPAEIRDWLKARSEDNSRTFSGELNHVLKAAMRADTQGAA